MLPKLHQARLYTFVDTAYLNSRPASLVARELCLGGSDIIQVRAKGAAPEQVKRLASEVLEVTSGFNVALVVNDFPDIAAELNIPFSHLGQEDFFVGGRKKMGELPTSPKVGVGLSTHSPADAKRALEAQPVYVAVGPVYATPTKPGRAAVGLDYVRWASANITQAPWFAIGGVNLANLEEVLSAGARRICVVSAILNAADIAQACQQFRQRLLSHPL